MVLGGYSQGAAVVDVLAATGRPSIDWVSANHKRHNWIRRRGREGVHLVLVAEIPKLPDAF
jgi:hypothetical protein